MLLSEGSTPKVRIFNPRDLLRHHGHSCRSFFFFFKDTAHYLGGSEVVAVASGSKFCLLISLVSLICSWGTCDRGGSDYVSAAKRKVQPVLWTSSVAKHAVSIRCQGTAYGLKAPALIRATATQICTTARWLQLPSLSQFLYTVLGSSVVVGLNMGQKYKYFPAFTF